MGHVFFLRDILKIGKSRVEPIPVDVVHDMIIWSRPKKGRSNDNMNQSALCLIVAGQVDHQITVRSYMPWKKAHIILTAGQPNAFHPTKIGNMKGILKADYRTPFLLVKQGKLIYHHFLHVSNGDATACLAFAQACCSRETLFATTR